MDPDRPILLTLDQQIERLNLRVDRLCRFLAIAVHEARRDPSSTWWRHHVVWTLRRLEQLGYSFPDVDPSPFGHRIAAGIITTDRIAA